MKDLALSCLAIALLTGTKATNLPLVLPWLTALFLSRDCLAQAARSAVTVPILLLAAMISFLPIALLNIHFTGSYSGDPTNKVRVQLTNPIAGMLGNSLQMAKDNLVPPLMPQVIQWESFLPSDLRVFLRRDYPRMNLETEELQVEEEAGVGLGIVLFTGLFVVAGIRAKVLDPRLIVARDSQALWLISASMVAWLVYMAKMGSETTSRLITPYYPLLIAGGLGHGFARRANCSSQRVQVGRLAGDVERNSPLHPFTATSTVSGAICLRTNSQGSRADQNRCPL